ncbi:hypothetical protein N0V82_001307 [Gnomoniopsis sp. IMI 355080]|nr:hypothetical protein N0V82_001307 [Gnomoniopsis sp. IMI 355080]
MASDTTSSHVGGDHILPSPPPPAAQAQSNIPYHEETNSLSSFNSYNTRELEKQPAPFESTTPAFRFNPKHWSLKKKIIAFVGALLVLAAIVIAIAVPLVRGAHHTSPKNPAKPLYVNPPDTALIASNTPLRIMPLGASITYGYLSTDGNGYREDLLGLLQRGGNTAVNFVGSRQNGTMTSNFVEGWPGYRIDQVYAKAAVHVPQYLPNVILLNVGTNDCVQNWNVVNTTKKSTVAPAMTANATMDVGTRLRLLVEDIFTTWSPNATVVMSTLILNKINATNTLVNVANAQFRAVAADLQAAGRRVVLADMTTAAGGPNITTMADRTHPDDVGYAMMADKWYEALTEAGAKGMIVTPTG